MELSKTTVGPPDSWKEGHPRWPLGQARCCGLSITTEYALMLVLPLTAELSVLTASGPPPKIWPKNVGESMSRATFTA